MSAVIGPRFWIRGIEPAAVKSAPTPQRRDFWTYVSGLVLEAKDTELRMGLDRDGNPFTPIKESTRKNRHSDMGQADPNAPPLTPAYGLSRTRSLFTAQATAAANGVVCWWAYDAHTDDSWGEILAYHRDGGPRLPVRNVFGLSPQSLEIVKRKAAEWWRIYQAGVTAPKLTQPYDTGWGRATELPAGGPEAFASRVSGGQQWLQRSETATPGVRQVTIGNHVYTMQGGLGAQTRRPPPTFGAAVPKPKPPPKPVKPQIAAMKPAKPKPAAAAKPAAPPKPPAFDWSKVTNTSDERYQGRARLIADKQKDELFWLARDMKTTPAELKAKANAKLAAVIESGELYRAQDARDLAKILEDGRFKSQFETGKSHGAFGPVYRSMSEQTTFATPENIDSKLRPIYGFLSAPNHASFGQLEDAPAAHYGRKEHLASVRLKPEVRQRATFTMGDSLGPLFQGAKITEPDIKAQAANSTYRSAIRRLVESEQTADELRKTLQIRDQYIEVQYHGGLKVEDIQDIVFAKKPSDNVVRLLAKAGIPWRIGNPQ